VPGDATKSAPRPPGRLLCLAAVQFGFGFDGVDYTAFGGYFLRDKFGQAVPEAAQPLALGILLVGLHQPASGLVADLGVRLRGRKAMLVRIDTIHHGVCANPGRIGVRWRGGASAWGLRTRPSRHALSAHLGAPMRQRAWWFARPGPGPSRSQREVRR
jgi:hypothetical protein